MTPEYARAILQQWGYVIPDDLTDAELSDATENISINIAFALAYELGLETKDESKDKSKDDNA